MSSGVARKSSSMNATLKLAGAVAVFAARAPATL